MATHPRQVPYYRGRCWAILGLAALLLADDPVWASSAELVRLVENADFNSSVADTSKSAKRVLLISPRASTRPRETHSALILSNTSFAGDFVFRGRVQTTKQLRVGSAPNPWECAWIVWNYKADHFYYLALKTNGWEIGKFDPAFARHQRFLKTGRTPFAVGTWHDFEIQLSNDEIRVSLNGIEIAAIRDRANPYKAGKFGFYTEDAEILVENITEPFEDDFTDYPLEVHWRDGQVLKNWFMPFLGHGYAAIILRTD